VSELGAPYIYVVQDFGPTPRDTICGDGWELELWDGHLCASDGYEGFDIRSEEDYRAFLAGLRKLAAALGWSENS
jgi:hypothetical protein